MSHSLRPAAGQRLTTGSTPIVLVVQVDITMFYFSFFLKKEFPATVDGPSTFQLPIVTSGSSHLCDGSNLN
jgi:hypothetical protein